jgi:hypothetical protein
MIEFAWDSGMIMEIGTSEEALCLRQGKDI